MLGAVRGFSRESNFNTQQIHCGNKGSSLNSKNSASLDPDVIVSTSISVFADSIEVWSSDPNSTLLNIKGIGRGAGSQKPSSVPDPIIVNRPSTKVYPPLKKLQTLMPITAVKVP